MKKITLLAAMALVAGMAHAQYDCNPSTSVVVEKNPGSVYYVVLSEGAIEEFEAVGVKCYSFAADPTQGCNLWYWDGFVPGDETYPRVDMEEGGYVSVQVTGTAGWSGAGFNAQAPGLNTSSFTENTHFHMAFMTPTNNAPSTIQCTLLDNTTDSATPFKFTIGESITDNGEVIPSIAPKANDDWQGIDITFAQMKKLFPKFAVDANEAWTGNYFTWLGGNVAGQTMAFDAIYFWNPKGDGDDEGEGDGEGENDAVEAVSADSVQFIQTGRTLNVINGNGIELYDMTGSKVKATNGTVVGIENLASGIYVAKSGKTTKKIVVK